LRESNARLADEGTRARWHRSGSRSSAALSARAFGRHADARLHRRALVTTPDLLLMDEPFGALDEFTRQRLDGELAALWADRPLTVVFVSPQHLRSGVPVDPRPR
jgi:ABC-type taurine transport system ATPase subunit